MKLLLFLSLASLATSWAAPPADYYKPAGGLAGEELHQALHDLIDDHRFLKYGETRAAMALIHQDPKKPANLIQIYTQKSVPKANHQAWNREHLWPRARGNTDKRGPDDTDLHHVFPSDYQVNADRASLLFDRTTPPRLASRWSMDADSFQPPAAVTGDIARALFYMAVRYDGSDRRTSNLKLVSEDFNGAEMGHLDVLLAWHAEDPPDAFEKRRNDLIFEKYQQNRNPFVDHPEFAALIWAPIPAHPAQQKAPPFQEQPKDDTIIPSCEKSSSSPSLPSSPPAPTEPPPSPPAKQPKPRLPQPPSLNLLPSRSPN